MKILRFSGPSNSGKTTLISELIQLLTDRGISVASIKHSHHPLSFSNKDSDRLFTSGARYSVLAAPNSIQITAAIEQRSPTELINWLFPAVDAVLIEGWREYDLPTILVSPVKPPSDWVYPNDIVGCVGWIPSPNVPVFHSPESIIKSFFEDYP